MLTIPVGCGGSGVPEPEINPIPEYKEVVNEMLESIVEAEEMVGVYEKVWSETINLSISDRLLFRLMGHQEYRGDWHDLQDLYWDTISVVTNIKKGDFSKSVNFVNRWYDRSGINQALKEQETRISNRVKSLQ